MKPISIFLAFIFSFTFLNVQAIAKQREMLHFSHTYKNITTGKSTEKEVLRRFGHPLKKTHQGRNYVYVNMIISLAGKQHKKVNTIQFINQNTYQDKNGVRIGDNVSIVQNRIDLVSMGNTMIDNNNGIIYWHNGHSITKIVLTSGFYKATSINTATINIARNTANKLSPLARKQRKIVSRLYQATHGTLNVCPQDKKTHFKQVMNDFEKRTGQLMPLVRSSEYWSDVKHRFSSKRINQLSNKQRNDYCRLAEAYYLKSVDKKMADEFIDTLLK